MSDITILSNPDCSTARNTLALIRRADIEPAGVGDLKTPRLPVEVRARSGELIGEIGVCRG